jgi:hypothetical protein
LAQSQGNIALPKWFCKLSSQTKSFFANNVNAILTLQLRPHAGQGPMLVTLTNMGPELQSQNCIDVPMLRKNCWSGSLAYKDTLEKQYFIVSEPKEEVISSKIDRLAAI